MSEGVKATSIKYSFLQLKISNNRDFMTNLVKSTFMKYNFVWWEIFNNKELHS